MPPPHRLPSGIVGRRDSDNISVYREQCKRKLCDIHKQKQAENVYVSLFRGLSLREYTVAHGADCHSRHVQPCLKCTTLMSVAFRVLEDGYCMLAEAFRLAFPDQKYKADIAMQRFLQMPLALIRVGTPQSGCAAWFLVEYVEGVDFVNFAHFSEAIFRSRTSSQPIGMDRDKIKALLGLARSDRERELIRYSIFKTSGLTSTAARQQFGFERMHERAKRVEECLEEAHSIREAIDKLSQVQDRALVVAMGLRDSESSESEADTETDSELAVVPSPSFHSESNKRSLPSFHTLKEVLECGQYNWFVVAEFLEHKAQDSLFIETPKEAQDAVFESSLKEAQDAVFESSLKEAQDAVFESNLKVAQDSLIESHLKEFYSHVLQLPLNSQERDLLTTSYAAFQLSSPDAEQCRIAAALNGDIVTDSESDNAEDYVGLTSVASERARSIIAKKRKSLARRVRRLKAKHLATKDFLAESASG